jgi:uncharacterized protein YkwD
MGETFTPASKARYLLVVVALLASIVVTVTSAPPARAAVTSGAFESCLLEKINADRAGVGVPALQLASDLTDEVRGWSVWMSGNTFRHMNSSERDPILPSSTSAWGENIAWSSDRTLPDCSSIHRGLMNSSGHRANILNKAFRFVALGAHGNESGWWVTELFFDASGYPAVPPAVGTGSVVVYDPAGSDVHVVDVNGSGVGFTSPSVSGVVAGADTVGTAYLGGPDARVDDVLFYSSVTGRFQFASVSAPDGSGVRGLDVFVDVTGTRGWTHVITGDYNGDGTGDEPGDGSFDHGPILPVVGQVVSFAPLGTCLGEELVVVADPEDPASSSGGAAFTDRASVTASGEVGSPGAADGDGDLVGAGDGSGLIIDGEIVSGVLVVAETPVPAQRYRFDHHGVFGIGEVGTHRTGSVSRIAEDLETRRFVFEERNADGSVTGVGWGQVTGGDDPSFGFNRDVGLVSVPIRRSGFVHVPRFGIHC